MIRLCAVQWALTAARPKPALESAMEPFRHHVYAYQQEKPGTSLCCSGWGSTQVLEAERRGGQIRVEPLYLMLWAVAAVLLVLG